MFLEGSRVVLQVHSTDDDEVQVVVEMALPAVNHRWTANRNHRGVSEVSVVIPDEMDNDGM